MQSHRLRWGLQQHLSLQHVQNTLARFVTQKFLFCRTTPVLADLHWLPVRHRLNFEIATIAFKVLHFQHPSYLAHALRSFSSLSICTPTQSKKVMLRTFGISYHVIFHPVPLFLLSWRDSSINFFECLSWYSLSIHWHHALLFRHTHEFRSHQMHFAAQLTRSSWAPTISLHFPPEH